MPEGSVARGEFQLLVELDLSSVTENSLQGSVLQSGTLESYELGRGKVLHEQEVRL